MNKCYIFISYETFIYKKRLHELPKALVVCSTFLRQFFEVVFHTFSFQMYTKLSLLFICHFIFFRRIFVYFIFHPGAAINSFSELLTTKGASVPLMVFVFSGAWTTSKSQLLTTQFWLGFSLSKVIIVQVIGEKISLAEGCYQYVIIL